MRKLLFLMIALVILISGSVSAIPDPSAVYCNELGYQFEINETEKGQQGICVVENRKFDAWEFFEGKVGKEYSYCVKQGYDIKTATDGKNPYSPHYAVCVPKKGANLKEISQVDLMNLKSRLISNIEEPKKESEPIVENQISSLPSFFDWRNKDGIDWMTPVKSQGSCGSCWAFAAVGAVEAQINIDSNNPYIDEDLSEEELVSDCCDYCGKCTGGSGGGALMYINISGIVNESCFPYYSSTCGYFSGNYSCDMSRCTYDCSNSICSDKCSNPEKLWSFDNYYYINDGNEKQYLAEKGPIVTWIMMDGSFDANGIYRCVNPDSGFHLITVVGYNDLNGYWIAKNSWGPSWNGDGYFKIGYGECGISLDYYVEDTCVIPVDGMVITEDTKFCPGTYFLPNGITIGADNIALDCNHASLKGNLTVGSGGSGGVRINYNKFNITIKNCNITGYNFGIYIYSSLSNTILNNNIYDNKYYAIYLHESANNIILNNYLYNNGGGIGLVRTANPPNYETSNNIIAGNNISNSSTGIFLVGTSSNILSNNTIYSNSRGLWLAFSQNDTIIDNTIYDSSDTGIYIIDNVFSSIRDNNINNPLYNLRNQDNDTVAIEYNWWGTKNETIIQQKIYDYYDDPSYGIVDYEPYLCGPYPDGSPSPCYDCALRIYRNISADDFEEVGVWCHNYIDIFPQKQPHYPQSERVVLHYLDKCSYPGLMDCCTSAEANIIMDEWVSQLCAQELTQQCILQWANENCTSITATENCTDSIDNDNDGFIDSEDQDCYEYRKIELHQGWNLVSSPFYTTVNATEALTSIGGCYKGIFTFTNGLWNMLAPGNPFANIDVIRPDKGYWINVNCTEINWTVSNNMLPFPAIRSFSSNYVTPLETVKVYLTVNATGVTVYAIDEYPPAGWAISNISDGAAYVNNRISWIFLDNISRTLTYDATASSVQGLYQFDGNFTDGVDLYPIGGEQTIIVSSSSPEIKVNEFESNPSSGNEWIELYNPGNDQVDISGWKLYDGLASPSLIYTMLGSTTISAGGYYVAELSSAKLNNGNDFVTLKDSSDALVDETPTKADSSGDNRTWQRVPDGTDNWVFKIETKGTYNNHAPIITSTPPTTVIEGDTYTYDVEAIDIDGDTLTYSLIESPIGMTINTMTGLIIWVTNASQIGSHHVTVLVEDGNGANDTQSFTMNVESLNAIKIYPLEDAYTDNSEPNSNFNNTNLMIGYDLNRGKHRSYLKFDLSELDGYTITDAKFSIDPVAHVGTLTAELRYVSSDSWSETAITWNNAPSYSPTITDSKMIDSNERAEFDVISLMDEPDNILSIALISAQESIPNLYVNFFSKDHGDEFYRPYITVTFSS